MIKSDDEIEKDLSKEIAASIRRALDEDIGSGDVTTNSLVPVEAMMTGKIIAKQPGIVAGLDVVESIFRVLDEELAFSLHVTEGEKVEDRQVLAVISGKARALLTGERTALNFLGRMSGIATMTHQFIEAVAGTKAVILDTRKTVPGLRAVDKLAVLRGGGQNHRFGLYDMILIKDNHIDFAGSLTEAVQRARAANHHLEIEVEARTLEEVQEALEVDVTKILLDNMTPDMMRQAVSMNHGRAKLEASGNVTLNNVRQVAETGVDYISIGALTHSAKTFDVSLLWLSQ
jgi:nicotinate-nucleotide pyrophosphorylase (carboxylating)